MLENLPSVVQAGVPPEGGTRDDGPAQPAATDLEREAGESGERGDGPGGAAHPRRVARTSLDGHGHGGLSAYRCDVPCEPA